VTAPVSSAPRGASHPDAGGPPALELQDIQAGYGRIEVLHRVSLTVPMGTVFALLGPNGAGKTTLLNVVGGKVRPTSGCVHIAGSHVNGADPDALSRAGVCRIPEGRGVFPNLTVAENLRMFTYASSLPADEVEEHAFRQFPQLARRRGQLAGTLSGGEQQMLALSRALVADRGLLLLDEISMGLAPLIVADLYAFVATLAAGGTTVLLTEQYARMALAVADYAAIMVQGRIAMVGQPADVAHAMSSAYLGGVS
jgi:branched-chain amino acid transport system ATP-binding protein